MTFKWQGYATNSWNPLCGCENQTCPVINFCWARKAMLRQKCEQCRAFEPHIHTERLDAPLRWRKSRIVAANFAGDWLCQTEKNIDRFLEVVAATPRHTYLTLTKIPKRLERAIYESVEVCGCRELGGSDYLPNLWLGVTICNEEGAQAAAGCFYSLGMWNRWISFEPLLSEIKRETLESIGVVEQIVIGAQTRPIILPTPVAMQTIGEYAVEHKIPLFVKANCREHALVWIGGNVLDATNGCSQLAWEMWK